MVYSIFQSFCPRRIGPKLSLSYHSVRRPEHSGGMSRYNGIVARNTHRRWRVAARLGLVILSVALASWGRMPPRGQTDGTQASPTSPLHVLQGDPANQHTITVTFD